MAEAVSVVAMADSAREAKQVRTVREREEEWR